MPFPIKNAKLCYLVGLEFDFWTDTPATSSKTEFSPGELWNSGVPWIISSPSEAPTKANDDTNQVIQYQKELIKYTKTLWVIDTFHLFDF